MVEWTYKEIIDAWRAGKIYDDEVLDHFEFRQPDDTPIRLLVWVIRFQMTGYGGRLLDEMRAGAARADYWEALWLPTSRVGISRRQEDHFLALERRMDTRLAQIAACPEEVQLAAVERPKAASPPTKPAPEPAPEPAEAAPPVSEALPPQVTGWRGAMVRWLRRAANALERRG